MILNSSLAALVGLVLSIILILRKMPPFYSLFLGAIVGGLLSGCGLESTVNNMFEGVKSVTPAILRILAAGVLSGVLIKSGAASSISHTIINKLGQKHIYIALALSTLLLTAVGVFIDVAVITVAPIAMMLGKKASVSKLKLLLAMIGGGKCGNIMSANPNTIVAAENYGADLSSVMAAGVIPGLVGLLILVYVILPLFKDKKGVFVSDADVQGEQNSGLPSFIASISGPFAAILLLALRPLAGITIDPMIALPVGGIVAILATGNTKGFVESISFGLQKMSGVAVLLVGTGTIAGVIAASDIKDIVVGVLNQWSIGGTFIAPISSILMSAATASTTVGATIASSSFAKTVLAAGVSSVWAASMTNAGATVLDHLPHGSFFHATGGSVNLMIKDRLKLIPFESAIGVILTLLTVLMHLIVSIF